MFRFTCMILYRYIRATLTLVHAQTASFNEKLLLSNGLSISPIKNQTDGGAGGVAQQARGLREAVLSIDNDRDLVEYVASWYSKLPPRTAEIKYERNAVLNPQPGPFGPGGPGAPQQQQQPGGPRQPGPMQYPPPGAQFGPGGQPQQFNMSGGIGAPPPGQQPPPGWAGPGGPFQQQQQQQFGLPQAGPAPPPVIPAAAQQGQRPSSRHRGSGQQHERSFSASTLLSRVSGLTGGGDKSQPSRNSAGAQSGGGAVGIGSGPINAPGPAGPPAPMQHQMYQQPSQQQPSQQQPQGPPQLAPLRFDAESSVQGAGAANQQQQELPLHQRQQQVLPGNPLQQHPPATAASPPQPPALQSATSQPSQPVFGVSLARLYERDGLAVPMVVYQCIQAVDLFGLNVEGIYRLSASAPNVTKLQQLFDNAGPNGVNSGRLDFRNPEHFFHDVNSVAVLLKTFLRELPDPLLTSEHYTAFIEAASKFFTFF